MPNVSDQSSINHFPMSLSPLANPLPAIALKAPSLSHAARGLQQTVLFVSTFRAKADWKQMMRYELGRIARATRRQRECLACDILPSPSDDSVFVIRSIWTNRNIWLAHKGWKGNPVGIGLLDLCLLEPIKTTETIGTANNIAISSN